MFKISQGGVEMFVRSLAGHDGATVLDSNAAEPSPVSETARINGMDKSELFALAVQTARQQALDDMAATGVITLDAATAMKSAPII
jgi:tryptophan synthase alpha subunit